MDFLMSTFGLIILLARPSQQVNYVFDDFKVLFAKNYLTGTVLRNLMLKLTFKF